jgi:hypothetical protein
MMDVQHGATPSDEQVGLEVIEGLGTSSADHLRRADISTLADLARFANAQQLLEHLRAHGVDDVPLRRILNERGTAGDWVSQAHRRQGRVWVVDFEVDRTAEPPRWTTTVSSDEPHAEQRFDGTEPGVWATWVIAQSGLPAQNQHEGAPADEDSWFRVATFDVVQPDSRAGTDAMLTAEVEVCLSGGDVGGVTSEGRFFVVDLLAVPERGGPPQRLASHHGKFAPGVLRYYVALPFPLPRAGTYHLYCVAFCPSSALLLEGAFGPDLRVIERPRAAS